METVYYKNTQGLKKGDVVHYREKRFLVNRVRDYKTVDIISESGENLGRYTISIFSYPAKYQKGLRL